MRTPRLVEKLTFHRHVEHFSLSSRHWHVASGDKLEGERDRDREIDVCLSVLSSDCFTFYTPENHQWHYRLLPVYQFIKIEVNFENIVNISDERVQRVRLKTNTKVKIDISKIYKNRLILERVWKENRCFVSCQPTAHSALWVNLGGHNYIMFNVQFVNKGRHRILIVNYFSPFIQ